MKRDDHCWLKIFTLLIIALFITSYPFAARAWFDSNWQNRMKIVIAFQGIESAIDNPVILIKLHSGNFDFTKVKEDGSDITFVDNTDTTPLKFHFERFDAIDEIAYAWVRINSFSTIQDRNFIWMYYGNASPQPALNVNDTYDGNYAAVFHFSDTEGMPQDQTINKNIVQECGGKNGLASFIGNGLFLNGFSDRLILSSSSSLEFTEGITFSVWLKMASAQKDAYMFARGDGTDHFILAIDKTQLYYKSSSDKRMNTDIELAVGTWQHICFSIDSRSLFTIYVNGIKRFEQQLEGDFLNRSGAIFIGGTDSRGHFFAGEMDELQISKVIRSEDWIKLSALLQANESEAVAFQVKEIKQAGGALRTILKQYYQYLKTIVRHTTVDGALINGLLIIMFFIMCVVLSGKLLSFKLINKENRRFLDAVGTDKELLSGDVCNQEFQNSSIFRVYNSGIMELKKRLGNASKAEHISSQEIHVIRNVLEKNAIREEQKLNTWLMILTMSISGGPFLGLLGTVWGIMNTFAAMAEAGEADIVVMAPGIASALSTTVVGLIVAIPALFGYNYLVARTKDITAEIYLFVDDFMVKTDEMYGEKE